MNFGACFFCEVACNQIKIQTSVYEYSHIVHEWLRMAQKDVLLTFSASEKSKKHKNCSTLEINEMLTFSS